MSRLPLSERPLEHTSRNGTVFTCARCDLSEPVHVRNDDASDGAHRMPPQTLASDVAEFIGYHATVILPELTTHFSGYDCIRWVF